MTEKLCQSEVIMATWLDWWLFKPGGMWQRWVCTETGHRNKVLLGHPIWFGSYCVSQFHSAYSTAVQSKRDYQTNSNSWGHTDIVAGIVINRRIRKASSEHSFIRENSGTRMSLRKSAKQREHSDHLCRLQWLIPLAAASSVGSSTTLPWPWYGYGTHLPQQHHVTTHTTHILCEWSDSCEEGLCPDPFKSGWLAGNNIPNPCHGISRLCVCGRVIPMGVWARTHRLAPFM